MKVPRILMTLVAAAMITPAVADPATLQTAKLGKKFYEDHHNGYKFRYPTTFKIVPVQQRELDLGILTQMNGPPLSTKVGEMMGVYSVEPSMMVLRIEEELAAPTTGSGAGGLKDRIEKTEKGRADVGNLVRFFYGGLRDFDPKKPVENEEKKVKKIKANHRTWAAFNGNYDIMIDAWTFPMQDADIVLLFQVPEQHSKKWLKLFEKAAKTFEPIERKRAASLHSAKSYEDVLAYHADEASRTPGWRVVPTPSEKYIIKTSSDNNRFIKEVIERLEKSRELFERDFPPDREIDHVSVVRVCATADEFHSYGGTGGGVAGWFSPSSTELVLYDFVEVNRNFTYAVMSHEAFHQYCHFLFDQSEAHRWFDEGHGDYYGGVKFKRKAVATPKMPAGLERLTGAQQLVREGTYTPLRKHLYFNHGQWQSQGPTNVSCYEQSWSIIYMLRQGALGKVSKKVWKDEYADIIPNYMSTLHQGFRDAYAEIAEERQKEAEEEGRDLTPEELEVNRFDLSGDRKQKIWDEAMAASWGKIDLDEFEENWKLYVRKHVK